MLGLHFITPLLPFHSDEIETGYAIIACLSIGYEMAMSEVIGVSTYGGVDDHWAEMTGAQGLRFNAFFKDSITSTGVGSTSLRMAR